jgi:glycosyltransferase involved in cell wall biosynthesis
MGEIIKISVIIPVKNCEETIGFQIIALLNQSTTIPYEIIISDNGSIDNTKVVIEDYLRINKNIKYLYSGERKGVSYARNKGAEIAYGDVLLFCDGDDIVEREWIEEMYQGSLNFDMWGGSLDDKILNRNKNRPAGKPLFMSELPLFGKTPFIVGANFGIKRNILEALGGWNEEYDFGSCDDVELTWKGMVNGYVIGFCQKAKINYRLRNNIFSHFKQTMRYGIGGAKLVFDFKKTNLIKSSSFLDVLNSLKLIVFSLFFSFFSHRHRLRLARRVGFLIGMVYGSVLFRNIYINVP